MPRAFMFETVAVMLGMPALAILGWLSCAMDAGAMLALLPARDRERAWPLAMWQGFGRKRRKSRIGLMQMRSQSYRHNSVGSAKTDDYLIEFSERPLARLRLPLANVGQSTALFKSRKVNGKGAVWIRWCP